MEGCAECLAELESLRSVSANYLRSVEIAPSAGFHEKLMARAAEAASAERASPVRGLRVAGPATRRLARIVERERAVTAWFRPRWRLAVLASSAAAVLAAVMISKAWVLKGPDTPDDETGLAARRRGRQAITARFKERKECAEGAELRLEVTFEGSWLDVSDIGDMAGEQEIVLTGVIDLSQHENCLLAFRAADWKLFADRYERTPDGPETERYRAIARSKQVVTVRDGRIEIPDVLLTRHMSGAEVVILRLDGWAEIWSRASLGAYMQHGIPARIGVDLEG